MKKALIIIGYTLLLGAAIFLIVYQLQNPDMTKTRIAINQWDKMIVGAIGVVMIAIGKSIKTKNE